LLRKDDTPMRGERVDMRQARWDGRPHAEARRATSSSKP
jgi:hypothetical protein